jgi:hypothetical protein
VATQHVARLLLPQQLGLERVLVRGARGLEAAHGAAQLFDALRLLRQP